MPVNTTQLGGWVSKQRKAKKIGKLLIERVQLLDKVGFIWDSKVQEWREQYEELKKYTEQHGNALVPRNHPTLGVWVNGLRARRKKGNLSETQIHELDLLGFVWDQKDHEWGEKFDQLKKYIADNGDALVPSKHPVGQWVQRQRMEKKQGKLSSERTERLDEVGFIWTVRSN